MLPLIGAGIGLAGTIGKMIGRGKANRELDKLLSQDPQYAISPIAKQRMGLAQQLLNARAPGASTIERNVFTNQATRLNSINNLATDSAQALALAGGAVGNTQDQLNQLGVQEAQDYQRRYQNLEGAQQSLISEEGKVYQDKIRRFENLAAVRGAQQQNRQANWQDVSNFGSSLMSFGLSGGQGFGLGNLFGGGQGGNSMSGGGASGYWNYDPRIGGYQTP